MLGFFVALAAVIVWRIALDRSARVELVSTIIAGAAVAWFVAFFVVPNLSAGA